MSSDIVFFGETTFRNQRKRFGIKTDDRRRHFYIIGKTGTGKTTMLENMVIQDIQAGRGVGVIDPHGEFAEKILDFVPQSRINDVIYFNPTDINYPIAFNVMEKVTPEYRYLVADGLMAAFKKIWADVWSARMEYILYNSILALLEHEGTTLLAINRMLSDENYRKKIVKTLIDPITKAFWAVEFAQYSQRYEVEATAAIQNKVGQFTSTPLIRNIVGQVKSRIDMRKIMDQRKILIVNLSKGKIGEDNSNLLGALLITKLQLAAMSRSDVAEAARPDFYLYIDEFQCFATESFVNILSEARKYHLCLILSHQYISQMEKKVRDAVFGNVGTIVSFRIGAEDAMVLEKEFEPNFTSQDLINLPKYNICLKLMIDGLTGAAFSAETLPAPSAPKQSNKEKIIKVSRERYGVSRAIIEDKISRWSKIDTSLLKIPSKDKSILYDAQCAKCEKPTKVVFKPIEGRPIYCESCLKKLKKVSEKQEPLREKTKIEEKVTKIPSFTSLKDALEKKPTLFHKPKKEVNLEKLRKILDESLDKKNTTNKE